MTDTAHEVGRTCIAFASEKGFERCGGRLVRATDWETTAAPGYERATYLCDRDVHVHVVLRAAPTPPQLQLL